jgi:hypothetical protein
VTDTWTRRLAPWFEHHRWRVMAEQDGEVTTAGVRISYDAGSFEIDPPGVYVTPFGQRGRRGVLVERIDGEDADLPVEAAFGESLLRRAQEAFGTISGLPEEG